MVACAMLIGSVVGGLREEGACAGAEGVPAEGGGRTWCDTGKVMLIGEAVLV